MVSRGSLPWRRGDFFPYTVWGGFGSKNLPSPSPYYAPEFRFLHRSKFSLYGAFRSRTACGQSADIYRPISGCFRPFSVCFASPSWTTGIASRRLSQEAEESLPLTPSEKFGGRAIKEMLCGVLRSYPAQCSREPLFGGLMVRFCRISPRLLEPLREDHSPAASFRPLNGSPYFPFSFRLSLEARIPWRPNAISSVLCWMNANEFAIRTPRYSRYRPYLVGL